MTELSPHGTYDNAFDLAYLKPSADSCIRGTLTETIPFQGPNGTEMHVDLSGDRLIGTEFIDASRVLDPALLSQLAQTGGLPSLTFSEVQEFLAAQQS